MDAGEVDLGELVYEARYSRTEAVTRWAVGVGVTACALYMIRLGTHMLRNGTYGFLIFAVLVLLCGLSVVRAPLRWRRFRLAVHSGGLAFEVPGQGSGRYRWQDLVAIRTTVSSASLAIGTKVFLQVGSERAWLLLRFADGRTVHAGVLTDGAFEFMQALDARSTPVLLERARAALARGESVEFGRTAKATSRGLVCGGSEREWERLQAVRLVEKGSGAGMLDVVDKQATVVEKLVYGDTANVRVLQALVAERAGRG